MLVSPGWSKACHHLQQRCMGVPALGMDTPSILTNAPCPACKAWYAAKTTLPLLCTPQSILAISESTRSFVSQPLACPIRGKAVVRPLTSIGRCHMARQLTTMCACLVPVLCLSCACLVPVLCLSCSWRVESSRLSGLCATTARGILDCLYCEPWLEAIMHSM